MTDDDMPEHAIVAAAASLLLNAIDERIFAEAVFAPLFLGARGTGFRARSSHDPKRIDSPALDRGSHWQSVLVADLRHSKEVLNAVRIDREIVRRPPGVREHDRRA